MERPRYRHAVLSVLLGLAVAVHAPTAGHFQASWDKQQQAVLAAALACAHLWRQTPCLWLIRRSCSSWASTQRPLRSTSCTRRRRRRRRQATGSMPVLSTWISSASRQGAALIRESTARSLMRRANDVLAITFEPGLDQCLWMLRPELANVRGLTEPARTWLEVSDVTQIVRCQRMSPTAAIFGEEPQRTWCYYFEKADLARQLGKWDEACACGARRPTAFAAANGVEMVPFIEAHARLGDWVEATGSDATGTGLARSANFPALCRVGRTCLGGSNVRRGGSRRISQVQEDLGCQP